MAIEIVKATSHLLEGVKVESTSRSFKMILDEPVEEGGTDSAMNPVEALLCALGSCQSIVAKMVAANMGLEVDDIKVELEGDLDPAGYQGDTSVRPGFQSIRSKFIIKSNASEEEIKQMVAVAEQFCPVGDTLSKGTKILVDYIHQ